MINKKIIFTALAASLIVSPLSTAFANEASTGETGAVAIADGTGGGGGLTIDLSPGVYMSYNCNQNDYALGTMNNSADAKNRLEYAIYSGTTGYYQRRNDNTDSTLEWDGTLTEGTDPFTGGSWTNMGGGS